MELQAKKAILHLLLLGSLVGGAFAQSREESNARCWDLYEKAQYQQGLELVQGSLEANPTEDLVAAESHHVMGELLFGLARYDDAIKAYTRALEIRRAKLPGDDPLIAQTLVDLGLPHKKLGDFKKARQFYDEALALAEKNFPKHATTARIHNNLGALLDMEGFVRSAEKHYQKALDLKRELGEGPVSLAATLSNLGEVSRRQERLDKATEYFSQALKLREKSLGPEHPDTLISRQNLAVIQMSLGQWDTAKASLEQCLEGTKKAVGLEHPKTATLLASLSVLHSRRYDELKEKSDLEQSTVYREEELRIRRKVQPKSPLTSDSILELALLRQKQGQQNEAVALMSTALHNRAGQSQSNLLARLSYLMADSCLSEGELDDALKHARNSLTLYSHTTGFKSISALNAVILYGRIQIARQDKEKSWSATSNFLRYYEENVAEVFSFASESQRLGYVNNVPVYKLVSLYGNAPLMARTVLRHKGLVLDSLLEDMDLARMDPESATVALRLQEIGEELVRLEMAGEKSARLTALRQEFGELQGKLARPFAQRTRRALQVEPWEVQKKIPQGARLVEYVLIDNSEYGAVILSRDDIRWVPLGPVTPIHSALADARRSLKRFDRGLESDLKRLYQLVWAPLVPALGESRRVIVSPDGRLNFVSFATLLTPEGKFLIEDFSLEYVASGRDLLNPSKAHRQDARLIGNVAFGEPAKQTPVARDRGFVSLNLSPLPGTEEECRKLGGLLETQNWRQHFSSGEQASESLVRDFQSPGILHLATHGFFLPKGERGLENPMLRSGLALAGSASSIKSRLAGGAPAPDGDGLLTAEEVGRLELQETWLVCLSSCETGLGEVVEGEGVLGLRRGFIRSGAQNLMLTLWPIDDTQTADFMVDFYGACLESRSPGRALNKVQRDWLVRLRDEDGLAQAVFVAGPFILTAQVDLQ